MTQMQETFYSVAGRPAKKEMTEVLRQQELEIEQFLKILRERVSSLESDAVNRLRQLETQHGHLRFIDYMKSRDISSECWAFSIVIEHRIDEYTGPEAENLRREFDQMIVSIWTALLNCSLRYLAALSREENLPLGSREIFVREIKTLYDANKFLNDSRYHGLIDNDVQNKKHQAERILNEIIGRAPALLELGR